MISREQMDKRWKDGLKRCAGCSGKLGGDIYHPETDFGNMLQTIDHRRSSCKKFMREALAERRSKGLGLLAEERSARMLKKRLKAFEEAGSVIGSFRWFQLLHNFDHSIMERSTRDRQNAIFTLWNGNERPERAWR